MYNFAIDLIKTAGQKLETDKREKFYVTTKNDNPKDMVTSLDVEISDFITEQILAEYPDHSIYSEEAETVAGNRYQWVLDPIDGSAAFSRGIPQYAISIGLLEAGIPVLGCVLDPVTQELFSFKKDEGAWLNGEKITTSSHIELAPCFVLFAAGRKDEQRDWAGESYKRLLGSVNKTKNFGSSALSLCYVAAGRLEASIYGTLTTMDIAAAIGILTEAGGVVTNEKGETASLSDKPQRIYVANNKTVNSKIIDLLESK